LRLKSRPVSPAGRAGGARCCRWSLLAGLRLRPGGLGTLGLVPQQQPWRRRASTGRGAAALLCRQSWCACPPMATQRSCDARARSSAIASSEHSLALWGWKPAVKKSGSAFSCRQHAAAAAAQHVLMAGTVPHLLQRDVGPQCPGRAAEESSASLTSPPGFCGCGAHCPPRRWPHLLTHVTGTLRGLEVAACDYDGRDACLLGPLHHCCTVLRRTQGGAVGARGMHAHAAAAARPSCQQPHLVEGVVPQIHTNVDQRCRAPDHQFGHQLALGQLLGGCRRRHGPAPPRDAPGERSYSKCMRCNDHGQLRFAREVRSFVQCPSLRAAMPTRTQNSRSRLRLPRRGPSSRQEAGTGLPGSRKRNWLSSSALACS